MSEPEAQSGRRQARILIVDDDEMIRQAFTAILVRAGYQTREAANGREALESYRAEPADLVLTDLYMPDTDGIELIIRMRTEFPAVKIVATSGGGHLHSLDVLERARHLGALATIPKPASRKAVLEAVTKALGAP